MKPFFCKLPPLRKSLAWVGTFSFLLLSTGILNAQLSEKSSFPTRLKAAIDQNYNTQNDQHKSSISTSIPATKFAKNGLKPLHEIGSNRDKGLTINPLRNRTQSDASTFENRDRLTFNAAGDSLTQSKATEFETTPARLPVATQPRSKSSHYQPSFGTVMTFPAESSEGSLPTDSTRPNSIQFNQTQLSQSQPNAIQPSTAQTTATTFRFSDSQQESGSRTPAQIASKIRKSVQAQQISMQRQIDSQKAKLDQLKQKPESKKPKSQAESLSIESSEAGIPANIELLTSVIGPEALVENAADEFEIIVTNNSPVEAKDLIIQVTIPAEITVTKLDRDSYLDQSQRTVSWKVSSIAAGDREVIRYSASCSVQGRYDQNVLVGMASQLKGETSFETIVISKSDYESHYGE
ncbi:MAG: hypothetical protein AAF623_00845 [Planctomycetota bacterium]